MSDIKKKTLVFSILDFLKTSVEDGSIKGDDKEGVDVASQSIRHRTLGSPRRQQAPFLKCPEHPN